MIWSKMCFRCRGDLYDREDGDCLEITCVQCGRVSRRIYRTNKLTLIPATAAVETYRRTRLSA